MSKYLFAAKVVGGAEAGTGTVVAGGYGIFQYIKSKESSENTAEPKNSNESVVSGTSQPDRQGSSHEGDTLPKQPSNEQAGQSAPTGDNALASGSQAIEQRDSGTPTTTTTEEDKTKSPAVSSSTGG